MGENGIVSGRRVAVRSAACVQAARAKKLALSVRNHAMKLVREMCVSSCAEVEDEMWPSCVLNVMARRSSLPRHSGSRANEVSEAVRNR